MKASRILLVLLFASQWMCRTSSTHFENFMAEEEHEIHVPTTATQYPDAKRSERISSALSLQASKNVNVIGRHDLVLQGTINGQMVETCTPGKQVPQNEVAGAVNP